MSGLHVGWCVGAKMDGAANHGAELGHIIPDSAMSAPHLWIIATFIAMVHFLKSFKKSVVLRFF
jgi:hypothetical protein